MIHRNSTADLAQFDFSLVKASRASMLSDKRGGAFVETLWSFGLIALLAAAAAPQSFAQDQTAKEQDLPTFHVDTFYISGGGGVVAGSDGKSVGGIFSLQAGGGFAVTALPYTEKYHGVQGPVEHPWSFWVTGNLLYNQADVKQSALSQAIAENPQNTGLLTATSAKVKYYSTTGDLTFRYQVAPKVSLYTLVGFGWLRRTVDFNGVSGPLTVIQSTSPSVFAPGSDSGAVEGGGGANFHVGLKGWMIYVEARVLHGIGSNSGATLVPLSGGVRW